MNNERMEPGRNGISYISFLPWNKELFQGITMRNLYGDPQKPFDLACDLDSPIGILSKSWAHFRESIVGRTTVVVRMEQVHSNRVETVSGDSIHEGEGGDRELYLRGCDGLITNVPNLVLTARVADCVPIFLYDRVKGAIGLLHAGWRGTVAEILVVGVERMKEEYGSETADFEVYLGPSIERACYAVNSDVYGKFDRWSENSGDPDGDLKVDLREINRQQAITEGIPEDKIAISRYCTVCSMELFYSHRASGGGGGRMAAFSALRK